MKSHVTLLAAIGLVAACSDQSSRNDGEANASAAPAVSQDSLLPVDNEIIQFTSARQKPDADRPTANPDRNAYFGDLHIHTEFSIDAYSFGTIATPADAYRYARGEAISHPRGFQVQLKRPLDFYAVTDHAFFLGLSSEAGKSESEFSRYKAAKPFRKINAPGRDGSILDLARRNIALGKFARGLRDGIRDGSIDKSVLNAVSRTAWRDTIEAAEQAYVPGVFTTFAAYEYTASTTERGNLHRNVVFRGTERLPALPFSRVNDMNPENLWDWMDGLRDQGIESLAIPHNSNGSNGAMFMLTDFAGNEIDQDYAEQRIRNEPLVEITQIKGTSETHPLLSKNDEWANHEIMDYRVATKLPSKPQGSYAREALLNGLSMAESGIDNPYKFGFIGSSDSHNGASSLQEEGFFSKTALMDSTPKLRGSVPVGYMYGSLLKIVAPKMAAEVDGKTYNRLSTFETWSASGLAGVWAEENTREAIYDALRRKETFATSGPRIKVRFFAGYELAETQLNSTTLIQDAYAGGVPMGGTLMAQSDREPSFLVWAVADANAAPLQRIQMIKGWLEDGEHREQVYDIACSDGADIDPETHRCPDNGARVNLSDCSFSTEVGDAELKTIWRDPSFSQDQAAFYYVRVLENPVCRWSTFDALVHNTEPRPDLAPTIQERAWSSPIWYAVGD